MGHYSAHAAHEDQHRRAIVDNCGPKLPTARLAIQAPNAATLATRGVQRRQLPAAKESADGNPSCKLLKRAALVAELPKQAAPAARRRQHQNPTDQSLAGQPT